MKHREQYFPAIRKALPRKQARCYTCHSICIPVLSSPLWLLYPPSTSTSAGSPCYIQFKWLLSPHYNNPLLMPKVIQPRRHDKQLSAEDFWKIRDEGKKTKTPSAFHAFRENEVDLRHRYQKPSEQAKAFNPLAFTLRPRNTQDGANNMNELTAIRSQEEETSIGEYLASVQGKVHMAVYEIKKLAMGRQSVLYNLEKIYTILWGNLHLEETWLLLQAVIRDSRGTNLSLWLQSGLKALANAASSSYQSCFNKPFFKNLFDTLCVLMECYYDPILESLQAYFLQFSEEFMKHSNKYIRKFSVQAFSYLLGNLNQEHYDSFLNYLVGKQGQGFFDGKLSLADLLLQRLKVVKGCLTTASLGHFLAQLQNLERSFQGKNEHFVPIAAEYIGLLLNSLNCRQGIQETQLLFDFLYVVKAVTAFQEKNGPQTYGPILVRGFSNFLASYSTDKKKFSPHTSAQGHYLRQLWQTFGEYFSNNTQYFLPREQLSEGIAALSINCGAAFLYHSAIISYCKQNETVTKAILRLLYSQGQTEAAIVEALLLLSREMLRRFILQDVQMSDVYLLIILIKRAGMEKLVELSWLGLTQEDICNKLERAEIEDDLLVTLRLLAYVRIPEDMQQAIVASLSAVYTKTMTIYEEYLDNIWSAQTQGSLQGEDFFNCANFPRELIIFAHHQIGWLSHVFNLYQAFSILSHHLSSSLPCSPIWQQLIISRPSVLSLIAAQGNANNSLIIDLLSSRNREVRHSALTYIQGQFQNPFSKQIIQWLQAIDREEIELSNEREVKRIFTNIEQHLQNMLEEFKQEDEAEQLYTALLKWTLGFAFTGFKLVENACISFLKMLFEANMHKNSPLLLQKHLMPFLHYYNYRHSRQYELDVSPQAPNSHLTNAFPIATPTQLRDLVKEDLQVSSLETVEWIGLERVSEALRGIKQGKLHLGSSLHSLVDAYFTYQFLRQAKTIQSDHTSPPAPFLLPPKVRFLVTILKLCPGTYLPPFQCLHYTREIFFQIESVRQIKRNPWQAMWQQRKGGDNQPRRKAEVAQLTSTTVNLEHLSAEEQRMYVSYLWKDILQGNRHKKRIIIDHLRNYLPTATPLLFQALFQHLHLPQSQAVDEETVNKIVSRLRMMNRKSLLNGMYILKALLIHLRREVTGSIKIILLFILSLIQIVYSPAQEQQHEEDKEQEDEKDDEVQEDKMDIQEKQQQKPYESQQEQQQQQGKSDYFQYKLHRKQLQKLLQTLFANHDLQLDNITELLQFLLTNTKINLAKSARLSIPGLLHILRILSGEKEYGGVMVSALNGEVVNMMTEMVRADEHNERPLRACFQIWMQIMMRLLMPTPQGPKEDETHFQGIIDQQMKKHSSSLLSALITYINAGSSKHEPVIENQKLVSKRREQEALSLLKLVVRLMELHNDAPDQEWQGYIWEQLGKLGKIKRNMTPQHCEKLSLLIVLLSKYIHLRSASNNTILNTPNSSSFLKKIITLLPSIRDPEQRLQVQQLMTASCSQLGLSPSSVSLVAKMGQIKKTALVVTMDFPAFFQACNQYNQTQFPLIDHEYFLFNLLCFADHEELSVRRAVTHSCRAFLTSIHQGLLGRQAIELVLKLYRAFLDLLSKQSTHKNEQIFWNTVDNIDLFFSWLANHAGEIERIIPSSHAPLYAALLPKGNNEEQQSYFKLMGSISQASKLKGLKLIRGTLQAVSEEYKSLLSEWSMEVETAFPNPISKNLLPILQYLILKPLDTHSEGVKSNLSSTFAKQALELLPLLSAFLNLITVKRELKRLLSKLRFSETESKKNAAVVKMVGALIDGVPGEKVSEKLHGYLEEHGFEQFHQKITQFSRSAATHTQLDHSDESDNDKDDPKVTRKERIPGFFQRLEELESEEAINRNFMQFDRKLMELQNEQGEQEVEMFPAFLKKHVLLPLRTMLLKESSGKPQQQEGNKSQVLLSVAITKVLLRLPLDLFLREFQKVVSRLGRLLKKREVQVRQNARNCLCEIARSVGPQLLYAIIIQLKFHLKDNFDKHVLNYSIFKVLDALQLKGGAVDYCLPLILPSVVDEIFGQSSNEKQMVEKREVKTLKMEAKKQKGLEILQVVCKAISADRIAFIIEFLEKFLREHLVTEVSLGKYDHMLGAITAGLSHNTAALDPLNAALLLPILADPVGQLRDQIRQLRFEDKPVHQNTARSGWRRSKAGKEQVLTLQEEAGRNRSIFKKLSKEVGERRNQEIIASSLIQFYLALLSFFLRRQVFTLPTITTTPNMANHFLTLLSFLSECVDQRDNRLVTKALKTLHIALAWNTAGLKEELTPVGERFKSIRKQTSRKILLLVQQLTLADEQLLRECFVFLNDLVSQSAVTLQMLPNFVSVIKLHTPTTDDQPHLPETYQLLRTLLFKCPQHLYHPLLDDLRLFVRNQLPTSRNKDLRDLAVSILGVYLRPRSVLEPSVEAYNRTEGRKGRVDYGKRLQEELSFYLSNLECAGQDAILQLLREFINNREPAELETYGELLLLGLMTARTNQIGREKTHPTDELIVKVAQGINAGKIGGLVEKALLWMAQPRGTSIRLCGVSFLRILLQQAHLKLSQGFIDRHVLLPGGLLERTEGVLREEIESLLVNRQQGRRKVDSQWDEILKDMEAEEVKYQSDPAVVEALLLLGHILSATDLPSNQSKALLPVLRHCWELLHSKEADLVESSIKCLMQASLLPVLHSLPSTNDPKSASSLRQTASALIFNQIPVHTTQGLLLKLISEEERINNGHTHLNNLAWLLLGLGLKAHIKANIYQQTLPNILQLLLNLPLRKDCPESSFRTTLLKQPNFQDKLLELAVKLTGNSLISFESRTLAQQVTEVLKQAMGVAEYFRAVGGYELKKRSKKEEDKARLAEMAILQPEEYVEMKRGKKRH